MGRGARRAAVPGAAKVQMRRGADTLNLCTVRHVAFLCTAEQALTRAFAQVTLSCGGAEISSPSPSSSRL